MGLRLGIVHRVAMLGLAVLGVGTMAMTAAAQKEIAFERVQHLKRGINLSMWYAQASDYSAARLASYTTADDFKLVHDLGFDHVRVSINPEPLIEERNAGTLRADAVARLDGTVQALTALGLVVVLDIHPEEPWKKEVTSTDDGAERFFNFWRNFAGHYASTDPKLVYFEVLNEPNASDVSHWAGEQARAIEIIRSQAPQHTIIATGAEWGSLDGLVSTAPVRDTNVIYTFHEYEPFVFTHQGASWMAPKFISLHGVPYPSSPEAVASLATQQQDELARITLERYGLEHWDGARMAGEIALAADWARRRHVPLWCGEFGAYRDYAPPAARARWISDVRSALEHNGIGWSMWDYQGGFGIVTKKNGITTLDREALHALGLK